jgi:hypothetical protein
VRELNLLVPITLYYINIFNLNCISRSELARAHFIYLEIKATSEIENCKRSLQNVFGLEFGIAVIENVLNADAC